MTTPPPNPSQTSLPLVQSTQLQPYHVPVAMLIQQPKIFCVTTTAASLGIDTTPPSADDYLVKPSSAGVYPTTSSAHLAGNSPANISSVRESSNCSHSNVSPLDTTCALGHRADSKKGLRRQFAACTARGKSHKDGLALESELKIL